jgi:hypothetical protein
MTTETRYRPSDTGFDTPAERTEAMHREFVRVGRRWGELVPWQTLAGWGAFLGGVGVLLWGIGSISRDQARVYHQLRASANGDTSPAAARSLLDRAQELVRR